MEETNMSTQEQNRQIVQEALDRKAAARRQRMKDADHDAAERQLRTLINQRAQERREAYEAAQAQQQHEAEMERQRAECKAFEDEVLRLYKHLTLHMFCSLIAASLIGFLFINDALAFDKMVHLIGFAIIYCTMAFIDYAKRITTHWKAAPIS